MKLTTALIVAAGSSRRMGFNKLTALLAGKPVLQRTLEAFDECLAVDEIIVVAGNAVFRSPMGDYTRAIAALRG